nr:MAG TPA: hypothetical protein [Caudoviricetes sp.]
MKIWRMPSSEIALRCEIALFDDRKSIRFFCVRTWRNQAMSNKA